MAALQAFWENGYASTSLNDLEKATGLGRRSLYNSFGNKQTVFLGALQDFQAIALEQYFAPLNQPGIGLEAIAEVLNRVIEQVNTPEGRLGCLICNIIGEPIANEASVAKQIELYFSQIEQGFAKVLKAAQEKGALPANENVTSLAHFYLGILIGLSVMKRAGAPIETLQSIASEALQRIP